MVTMKLPVAPFTPTRSLVRVRRCCFCGMEDVVSRVLYGFDVTRGNRTWCALHAPGGYALPDWLRT